MKTHNIKLTTKWQEFSIELTAQQAEEKNGGLMFHLGKQLGVFEFAELSLVELD